MSFTDINHFSIRLSFSYWNITARVSPSRPKMTAYCNTYRVPYSELALSGAGKTCRHQHAIVCNECQLGRFTFSSVTLAHLSDDTYTVLILRDRRTDRQRRPSFHNSPLFGVQAHKMYQVSVWIRNRFIISICNFIIHTIKFITNKTTPQSYNVK